MARDVALIRWMRSVLRLTSLVDPDKWTDAQVLDTFFALSPEIRVPFESWAVLRGIELEEPEAIKRANDAGAAAILADQATLEK